MFNPVYLLYPPVFTKYFLELFLHMIELFAHLDGVVKYAHLVLKRSEFRRFWRLNSFFLGKEAKRS